MAGAAGVLTPGIPARSLGPALEAVGQGIGVVHSSPAPLSDVAPGPRPSDCRDGTGSRWSPGA